eukprot:1012883-Rhodomonas_salina.2
MSGTELACDGTRRGGGTGPGGREADVGEGTPLRKPRVWALFPLSASALLLCNARALNTAYALTA